MPRISDHLLECVTYLYPSESEALRGDPHGGSGFLYGLPSSTQADSYNVFLVTCRHVLSGQDAFVRLNTHIGGYKILRVAATEWKEDSTEDIKVTPIKPDSDFSQTFVRGDRELVDAGFTKRMAVGPGDDIFVVGRFVQHAGRDRNLPVVRFGSIAMMPEEPVYNAEINLETLCYLVDLRIRSGFSGSPVFLQYSNRVSIEGSQRSGPWSGERLLGICWGMFTTQEQVKETLSGDPLPSHAVGIPEGMACVAPAQRIDDLLRQGST